MTGFLQRFLHALAGCGLGLAAVSCAGAATFTGTVTVVRDGDTVQVTTDRGEKLEVRLQGIDAPEKAWKKRRGQPFARQSRDALNRLAWRKRVTVETAAADVHGRRVGTLAVSTPSGPVDAGLLQVRTGMAWTYPRYLPELPEHLSASYRRAESMARANRRGLWADEKPQPPWLWRPQTRPASGHR